MGAICERDTRSRKQVRMKGVWTDEDGLLRCTTTYDNIQSTVSKAFLELGGKYVYDHSLDRMEPQSSGTTKLYFSDGSTEEADLVICADGFASPCRKALYATKGLDGSYKYTGYLIWRGILYPDEIDDPEVLKALLPNGGKERSDLWMYVIRLIVSIPG